MNEISAFFVRNIVVVFFFYGLAFFVMGLALLLASRLPSAFRFSVAIVPLALFGFLHAAHEWVEMFQKIAALTSGYTPAVAEELVRLVLLVLSFVALLVFGLVLLMPAASRWRLTATIGAMLLLWLAGALLITVQYALDAADAIAVADGLARYVLGIPAAILGAWALMAQQRTFREHNMPQFGRDLVWSAAALLLYGGVGQMFVRETVLAPTHLLSSANFLLWFGIPVQLFRAVMAAGFTFFLVRALRAFEVEDRRRLEQETTAKLAAQAAILENERRNAQQTEQLNEELRVTAYKLSVLLDLSNLLNAPKVVKDRFGDLLAHIVESLPFSDAGLIVLAHPGAVAPEVAADVGFPAAASAVPSIFWREAEELGLACVTQQSALCRHYDGAIVAFLPSAVQGERCRQHLSPTRMIALPLANQQVMGSLVLARTAADGYRIQAEEMALILGIAQQIGLSVENAVLQREVVQHERMLAELLRQIVTAQEAERQRIARELHDATGQSLTAVALGLSGIEAMLGQRGDDENLRALADQVHEIKSFSTNALGELRTIIADLRPPQLDDLGLVAALRWYLQAYERRRQIACTFEASGDENALPVEYKTVLFRIAQEALTNVAKHAAATAVTVKLCMTPTQVDLTVGDNGRGFDPATVASQRRQQMGGWGLMGMRERALLLGGECTVTAQPGAGTMVHVCVPISNL
jgi:signal transduction histidine kinase